MKIYLLTDTHFGCKNNSIVWMQMMNDYIYQEFIPYVQKTIEPGDILIHLGDMFDNRSSIGLKTLKFAIDVMTDLSDLFSEIHVICGNHDAFNKNSNDVCSVELFSLLPNVTVYKEPKVIDLGAKKALLMPWINSVEKEEEIINQSGASVSYLFCHSEINGAKLGTYTRSKNGQSLENMVKFEKVFAGHIHYRHNLGNVVYLGTPYPMTFNDKNNTKGFHILHPEDNSIEFIENTLSPRFLEIDFNSILEWSLYDCMNEFKDKYVRILISQQSYKNCHFTAFINKLKDITKSIEIQLNGDLDTQESGYNSYGDYLSVEDALKLYLPVFAKQNNLKENMQDTVLKACMLLIDQVSKTK